jgi:Icc protein
MVAAMTKPLLLGQLSDLHICEEWEGVDPAARLERVTKAIEALPNRFDAVVVSGDLADDGSGESYERARQLLERLKAPLLVLPGNHDDRRRLREVFDLPGAGADPVNYSATVGPLRVVVFDSIVPGQDPGAYEPEQLRWLDQELGEDRQSPTLLALHHPPLSTGIPEWDAINLTPADREAMAAVVARHPQVRAIVGGHLHRTVAGALAGCPVFSAPSTCLQVRPDFERDGIEWVGPSGFALHVLGEEGFSSQAEMLGS